MQPPQDEAAQAKAAPAKGGGTNEHDHAFDRGHAGLQLGVSASRTEDEQFFDGVHTVTGVGKSLAEKYNKAKEAKNAAQVLAIADRKSVV